MKNCGVIGYRLYGKYITNFKKRQSISSRNFFELSQMNGMKNMWLQ